MHLKQLISILSSLFVCVESIGLAITQDEFTTLSSSFLNQAQQQKQIQPQNTNKIQLIAGSSKAVSQHDASYLNRNNRTRRLLSVSQSHDNNSDNDNDDADSATQVIRIRVAAIYVNKSEFPLSKLLFKLALELALSEASKYLEQQRRLVLNSNGEQQAAHSSPPPPAVKLMLGVRDANTCSRQYASALAAEEYYKRSARLFIVSGCDDAIRGVSRLASRWRVPIMTAAGFGTDLNDKLVHKTLVRVAFSLKAAVEFLFKIIKSFQWRRINLIVDESDANSLALRGSIEKHSLLDSSTALSSSKHAASVSNSTSLTDQSKVIFNTIKLDLRSLINGGDEKSNVSTNTNNTKQQDDKWPNEFTERIVRETLWQCSVFSRVSILLIPQHHLRKFMLSVHDAGMANGLYTFINMPLLLAPSQRSSDHLDGALGETSVNTTVARQTYQFQATTSNDNLFIWRSAHSTRNAHAKQAFESLMSILLRTPTTREYIYFVSKISELANTRPGVNETQVGRSKSSKQRLQQQQQQLNINPYLASFYDSIQIYAIALGESIKQSILKLDHLNKTIDANVMHARISELVRNRRYVNMVTGNVFINTNGDRETDYTLDDMNQMTGKFAPVILYRGETRDIERLGRIHWSSDATVGPTSDAVDCTLAGTCIGKPMTRFNFLLILLAVPLVLILSSLFCILHNRLSLESQLVDYWWKIHLSDLEIIVTRRKNVNDGSLVYTGRAESMVSSMTPSQGNNMSHNNDDVSTKISRTNHQVPISERTMAPAIGEGDKQTVVTRATSTSAGGFGSSAADVCYGNITLAIYKLSKVALKPISKLHQSRKLMIELRSIKELNHSNLCRFIGILVDEGNLAVVNEFCPKGSLREFFHNDSMVIDWTFKYSIINDIIAGLLYLHSSSLGFHGRLKSSNCLVSARFVVKLSDYGPRSIFDQVDDDEHDSDNWYKKRIWLAPEHMRPNCSRPGSMKGDVYSFGLLLYEIITNCLPFVRATSSDEYTIPLKTLYNELKQHGPDERIGPDLSAVEGAGECDGLNVSPLVELMKTCWRFDANKRPSSMVVNAALKKITRGITSKKLLENLTSRMEQYTNNLESLVEAKLATLVEEQLKTEELLYQFVPKSIASLLKEGQYVEPEAFECVTVFYSDIVGFTSLSSESSPMQVVDFLSDLYVCFDETLEQHDIFKVDTIGDAYIVASGLPQRNDGKHVIEIARAALELRDRLKCFRIPHKPERRLEMRVGVHSGSCIAGIVGGLNMPKYCVFGDTLTTGKFMESSGLPMKIHITEESRRLLANVAEFCIEPRVPKITKDGLPLQTYWLERGGVA